MKIKQKLVYLFLALSISLFTSCDEGGDPEIGATSTVDYAGDWYITLRDSDGLAIPGVPDNALHQTYNTAANDNTMWIDDSGSGYEIKCKVTVNKANGTFTATNSPNLLDVDTNGVPQSTVTITNGQVIKLGGTSKGGHTVDKIVFTAHFSYDTDGYNINYEGTKRTGFFEDEY